MTKDEAIADIQDYAVLGSSIPPERVKELSAALTAPPVENLPTSEWRDLEYRAVGRMAQWLHHTKEGRECVSEHGRAAVACESGKITIAIMREREASPPPAPAELTDRAREAAEELAADWDDNAGFAGSAERQCFVTQVVQAITAVTAELQKKITDQSHSLRHAADELAALKAKGSV